VAQVTAVAWVQSLAQELPCATGPAKNKKTKNKQKIYILSSYGVPGVWWGKIMHPSHLKFIDCLIFINNQQISGFHVDT